MGWREKRCLWSLVLLTLIGLWIPGSQARERVAVVEFGGVGDYYERHTASSLMAKALIDLGRFDVMERDALDRILQEQRFQQSYPVDQATVVAMGRIAGVNVAFLGQIDTLDARWHSDRDGNGYYLGSAKISVKVVDVQSGQLIKILVTDGTATGPRRDGVQTDALVSCFGVSMDAQLRALFSLSSQVTGVDEGVINMQLGRDAGGAGRSALHHRAL